LESRNKLTAIRNILFDLDGTLTDPKEGIIRCMQYAMENLCLQCPPPEELHIHIGPPIRNALAIIMKTEDEKLIEEALRIFRVRFSEIGLFENEVFAGVPEMLGALRESNRRLFIATSKPLVFTERILHRFGLAEYFDGIYGSQLDGTLDNKAELIGHLISSASLVVDETLMVGDRMYDILGARKNGCLSMGVTYGYGSAEELRSAGADLICNSPSEIAAHFSKL
jgi:phosphoglycolate phosphatase